MPGKFQYKYLAYDNARKHILDGDVLLYRGRTLVSKVISKLGRSRYSHVGMAGWTNGNHTSPHARLMAYEMLYTGGQLNHLSAHAEKFAGRVDVYRLRDKHTEIWWEPGVGCPAGVVATSHTAFDRKQSVAHMRDFCRQGDYGYLHLMWIALRHSPFLRFFFKSPTDDALERRTTAPTCSEAVAYALRKAFADPARNTPDHYTEPADLARSPMLNYLFTLTPAADDWLPQPPQTGDVLRTWPIKHEGPALTGHALKT